MLCDVFVSHAGSEDGGRPSSGRARSSYAPSILRPWYDEFTLNVGDSLRRSIDRGLSQSRFGLVVLSPGFFTANAWSQ